MAHITAKAEQRYEQIRGEILHQVVKALVCPCFFLREQMLRGSFLNLYLYVRNILLHIEWNKFFCSASFQCQCWDSGLFAFLVRQRQPQSSKRNLQKGLTVNITCLFISYILLRGFLCLDKYNDVYALDLFVCNNTSLLLKTMSQDMYFTTQASHTSLSLESSLSF